MNVAGATAEQSAAVSCVYCGDGHSFDSCPSNPASVCYVGNFNKNNNPFSNTYNQGWRQHPNFSWSNQGVNLYPTPNRPNHPPGFQQQLPQQQQYQKQQHSEQSSSMESLLKEYMAKNNAIIQNQSAIIQSQAASLRNLENQMGQLANALNSRP